MSLGMGLTATPVPRAASGNTGGCAEPTEAKDRPYSRHGGVVAMLPGSARLQGACLPELLPATQSRSALAFLKRFNTLSRLAEHTVPALTSIFLGFTWFVLCL